MNVERVSELQNMPEFLFEAQEMLEDPRDENCFSTMKSFCCPSLYLTSTTVLVTIINIMLFGLSWYLFGLTQEEHDIICMFVILLEINYEDQLICSASAIKYKFEFYRLITSVYFHKDLMQLFMAVFAVLIIGSMTENYTNRFVFLIVYNLTGIGGNLTCILFTDLPQMGNEFSIFGLLGCLFGFLIQQSNEHEQTKQILMVVVFYITLNFVFGFVVPEMSNFGHSAALVVGLLCGTIFQLRNRPLVVSKIRIVSTGILFLYISSVIYLFYTYRTPKQ